MAKVTVKTDDRNELTWSEVTIGEAVVITSIPPGHYGVKAGDIAVKAANEGVFYPGKTWNRDLNNWRFRRLRPGEKLVIEGE